MKINLLQLDAGGPWRLKDLGSWLSASPRADLTVFPECYPFWNPSGVSHSYARRNLELVAEEHRDKTFIAGGYVYEKGSDGARLLRNRAFLIHRGYVVDYYDKQCLFEGETFIPGDIVTSFTWGDYRCIPLICADADQGPNSPFMAELIDRALVAGAGPTVPIIVCSYGAFLTEPYWTDSLHHLADSSNAPVVICGIAGRSSSTFFHRTNDGGDDTYKNYGGGGSGLFLAGQQSSSQHSEPGVIVVDLDKNATEFNKF